MMTAGARAQYVEFLKAIKRDAGEDVIVPLLGDRLALVERYRELERHKRAGPAATAAAVSSVVETNRKALIKQVEYYFSRENLAKDRYLRSQMSEEGWVAIELIAGFPMVQKFGPSVSDLIEIMVKSEVVETDKVAGRFRAKALVEAPATASTASTRASARAATASTMRVAPAPPLQTVDMDVGVLAAPAAPLRTVDMDAEVLAPLRARGGDVAAQLVNLLHSGRGARASLRLAALRYVRSRKDGGMGKEMILLRGPPGTGKTAWAEKQLKLQIFHDDGESQFARIMHICAAEALLPLEAAAAEPPPTEKNAQDWQLALARNEAKASLAVEIGVSPLYVDGCHMQLWEMSPYVRIAQKAGYDVTLVAPEEISTDWDQVDVLLSRLQEHRPELGATLSRDGLESVVRSFEALPLGDGAIPAILAAKRKWPPPVVQALSASRGA